MSFNAVELGFAHAVSCHAGQLFAQRDLHLLGRLASCWHAVQHEELWATAPQAVVGACAVGNAVIALGKGAIQPRAAVAVQHGGKHGQRQRVSIVLRKGVCRPGWPVQRCQSWHLERQRHIRLLGRGFEINAAQASLRRLDPWFSWRYRARGNGAVVFFGKRPGLRHIHVARYHHRGIGRDVPGLEELTCVSRRHRVQVAHPADDGPAVRRRYKNGRVQQFVHQRARAVFRAQAALFLDHFQLSFELVIAPLVGGETVGLNLHHIFEAVAGNLLVVAGEIPAGKGVFASTQRCHRTGKIARLERGRALEHHVLQQMRHARGAIHLVHRPHPQPHHVHCRGRATVGLDNHRHAVRQLELLNFGRDLSFCTQHTKQACEQQQGL